MGEAGALIPPFDYHVIENPFSEPAATVHVYGGEMECCEVFLPEEDGEGGARYHRRGSKKLRYTPDTPGPV